MQLQRLWYSRKIMFAKSILQYFASFSHFLCFIHSRKKIWNFVEKFAKYERKFPFFNCYLLFKSICIQSIKDLLKDVLKISRGVSQYKKGVNDYFYLDCAIFVLCKWKGAYVISLRVKKQNCDKCLYVNYLDAITSMITLLKV